MKERCYIPAFTIMEAVVSMAITAIVLSIIFVVFSITSQRLFDFKKQNETIADLNRMMYSLNKAIFENEELLLSDNEIVFNNYNGENTIYTMSEKYFVRLNNEFSDTFHLAVSKVILDTLNSTDEKNKFQRLHFIVKVEEKETELNFYKKIYAEELITMKANEY